MITEVLATGIACLSSLGGHGIGWSDGGEGGGGNTSKILISNTTSRWTNWSGEIYDYYTMVYDISGGTVEEEVPFARRFPTYHAVFASSQTYTSTDVSTTSFSFNLSLSWSLSKLMGSTQLMTGIETALSQTGNNCGGSFTAGFSYSEQHLTSDSVTIAADGSSLRPFGYYGFYFVYPKAKKIEVRCRCEHYLKNSAGEEVVVDTHSAVEETYCCVSGSCNKMDTGLYFSTLDEVVNYENQYSL